MFKSERGENRTQLCGFHCFIKERAFDRDSNCKEFASCYSAEQFSGIKNYLIFFPGLRTISVLFFLSTRGEVTKQDRAIFEFIMLVKK